MVINTGSTRVIEVVLKAKYDTKQRVEERRDILTAKGHKLLDKGRSGEKLII
jgi:hypothetical protein